VHSTTEIDAVDIENLLFIKYLYRQTNPRLIVRCYHGSKNIMGK